MESHPISSRPPQPLVRGAGETSDRESRSGQERRREAFREARKRAAGDEGSAAVPADPEPARRAKRGANPGSRAKASAPDETDARGRKLDIRV